MFTNISSTTLDIFCAGLKCHCHLCNDLLIIYVCCGILPSESFSCSLWYVSTLQHPDNLYKIVFSYFFDSHVTSWSFATFMAALYFAAVATIAAFIGQHVVRKLIILFGRASLIIFILAFTIFVSAISLGEHYCSLLFCLLN